jgi:hypothetical protein
MFTIKSLNKIKNDFFLDLKKDFNSISPVHFSKNEGTIFQKYSSLKSLAGMENWLVNYYERDFFMDVINRLSLIQSNDFSELENFKKDLLFTIKQNFREEDFRFYNIENTELSKKSLLNLITFLKKENDQSLTKLSDYYINDNSYQNYYKSTGKPSVLGLNTKLVKKPTPRHKIDQLKKAEIELSLNWKYGYLLYKTLTNSLVIVSSPDLVSYSHFTELGVSYINIIDRELFDTVDDLIHENSHHHLNLILKKYKLIKHNNDELVFYSPWRQSVRNIYAILHSVFTFSYGAMLFENILKNPSPFMKLNYERTAFRLLEETIMLQYSLTDLLNNKDRFFNKGKEIISYLNEQNKRNFKNYNSYESLIKSKSFKKKLSDLENTLKIARKTYHK